MAMPRQPRKAIIPPGITQLGMAALPTQEVVLRCQLPGESWVFQPYQASTRTERSLIHNVRKVLQGVQGRQKSLSAAELNRQNCHQSNIPDYAKHHCKEWGQGWSLLFSHYTPAHISFPQGQMLAGPYSVRPTLMLAGSFRNSVNSHKSPRHQDLSNLKLYKVPCYYFWRGIISLLLQHFLHWLPQQELKHLCSVTKQGLDHLGEVTPNDTQFTEKQRGLKSTWRHSCFLVISWLSPSPRHF